MSVAAWTVRVAFVGAVVGLFGCGGDGAGEPRETPMSKAVFRSTHNSYSGGARGTLPEQLEAGVRFVELDLYGEGDGFLVGHDAPGDQVELGGGNPTAADVEAWIALLAEWRDTHPDKALLTVMLDIKSDLDAGAVASLEALVTEAFGERLLRPGEVTGDTIAEGLAGRVLVVLSGNLDVRLAYKAEESVFFIEYQQGDPEELRSVFFATSALNFEAANEWAGEGAVLRLWALNFEELLAGGHVTYPATDLPNKPWYENHCTENNALE